MRSIGTLSDVSGSSAWTDRERIEALEKRVATLEGLLSDVMHQLDTQHEFGTKQTFSEKTPKKPKTKTKGNKKNPDTAE